MVEAVAVLEMGQEEDQAVLVELAEEEQDQGQVLLQLDQELQILVAAVELAKIQEEQVEQADQES
jgi:hypothetical protein